MAQLPQLEDLLNYTNPHVIARYQRDFPESAHLAHTCFRELLRYFWLCEKHAADRAANPDDPRTDFTCIMHVEMQQLDDMWHMFLLFTRDYAAFCQTYFGHFLHHVPNVVPTLQQTPEEFEEDLRKYLTYVDATLGSQTLRTWFSAYV